MNARSGAEASWPAAGRAAQTWVVSAEVADYLGPRRTAKLDGTAYFSAVPARIADMDPTNYLSASTARAASEALQDLVWFAGRSRDLPPVMGSVLLRAESASSSQIEHLTSSARRLAEAELGLDSSQNARLITANTAAMEHAIASTGALNENRILEAHSILMDQAPGVRAGAYRQVPVWIGGSNYAPVGASFVGPAPSEVQALMEDLTGFIERSSADALTTAAIAHAQFETIHPFEDGNGRTGRALAHMILGRAGYSAAVPLPLSAGLLSAGSGYFSALEAYREGEPDPIVSVFAAAASEASAFGLLLSDHVEALRDKWRARVRARSDSSVWGVLDQLFANPVVSIPYIARALGISDPAAMRAIHALADAGVLEQSGRDRRQKSWRAPEVLELLDEVAYSAPRRSLVERTAAPDNP